MASTVESDVVKKYRKAVATEFNSQYSYLSSALEGSMQKFAEKALGAALISPASMKSKNFDNIAVDFLAGLNFKDSVVNVQQYCQCFVDILEDLGGPAVDAARDLSVRWSAAKLLTTSVNSGMHESRDFNCIEYSLMDNEVSCSCTYSSLLRLMCLRPILLFQVLFKTM